MGVPHPGDTLLLTRIEETARSLHAPRDALAARLFDAGSRPREMPTNHYLVDVCLRCHDVMEAIDRLCELLDQPVQKWGAP